MSMTPVKPRMPRITPSESLGGERVVVERMPRIRPSESIGGERVVVERMPRYTSSRPARMNSPGGAKPAADGGGSALLEQLRTMIGMTVSMGENVGYFRYTSAAEIAQVKQHLAEHALEPLSLKHHKGMKAYADADQQIVVLVRGSAYFAIPPGTLPAELFAAPGLKR